MPRGKRRDLSAQFPHANADINGGAGDGSAEVDADAAAAVNELMATAGYYVPTVAASDVSTSGDEDDEAWITSQEGAAEGSTAGGVASSFDASNAHNSLFMDSENSDEDEDEEEEGGPGGSSFGGAASSGAKSKREATCRWEDCGEAFMELTKFIDHLHRTHVGHTRPKYSCEWTGCSRRGKPQTSRFALLSHLRSHTGEKPFTCPRPECDKSFTRSDALSKHMRVQHDIQPAPARGGRQSAVAIAAAAAAAAANEKQQATATRSSGRRSTSNAFAASSADSVDDELLNLAGGGGDRGCSLIATMTAENTEALPGEPVHWEYDVMFPSHPQDQSVSGVIKINEEELGIERLSSLRARLGLSTNDDSKTCAASSSSSSSISAGETVSKSAAASPPTRSRALDAETLELARRQWVQEMGKSQADEIKLPGGGKGVFLVYDGVSPPISAIDPELSKFRESASGNEHKIDEADGEEDEGKEGEEEDGMELDSNRQENGYHVGQQQQQSRQSTGRLASSSFQHQEQLNRQFAALHRGVLVESAKISFLRLENARLVRELEEVVAIEAMVRQEKTRALEFCLEAELGADVRAIFTPEEGAAGAGDETEAAEMASQAADPSAAAAVARLAAEAGYAHLKKLHTEAQERARAEEATMN